MSSAQKSARVRKTTSRVIAALVRAGLTRLQALEVSRANVDAALAIVAHPDRAEAIHARADLAMVGVVLAARERRAA